jgi:hypothetical protein
MLGTRLDDRPRRRRRNEPGTAARTEPGGGGRLGTARSAGRRACSLFHLKRFLYRVTAAASRRCMHFTMFAGYTQCRRGPVASVD